MDSLPDPPVLAYATDLPTRYGIVYELNGRRARIVVPYSRRLLYRAKDLTVPFICLAYAAGAAGTLILRLHTALVGAVQGLGTHRFELAFALFVLFTFGLAAAYGTREWYRRFRSQTVFELTDDRLIIRDEHPPGRHRTRTWKRQSVADVSAGVVPWNASPLFGLGLHIRISGRTIVEVMPGHDPEVAQWVAARLNEALRAPAGPSPGGA